MKLAVSNIAWNDADEPAALPLLRQHGVTAIEVAPTRLWPDWTGATTAAARAARARLAGEGFEVPSFQAILFGKPDLSLFGDTVAFTDHVLDVADLAAEFGARVLVYGAPTSRDRSALSADAAFARAVEVFRRIGAECAALGVTFCIEPNPPAYGCNFITTSSEGLALVQAVDSPGFALHLDAAGMVLAGEEPASAILTSRSSLRHFHASEPHLAPIVPATVDHAHIGRILRRIGYDGWVAIEMRRTDDSIAALVRAVDHVRACYRDRLRVTAPAASAIEAVA